MTVFEMLNLRSEFEDLVLNFRVPGVRKPGTLDNLRWFVKNGQKNHKKDGYDRALEIAQTIISAERARKKAS